MPRSAPLARASLMVCLARSGPMEMATTSPPCFSFRRRASSSAKESGSLVSKPMSDSRIQAPASRMARGASFAGTCLTQTAIFKNASEKWRCEQSDSFYQNFVFGATGQIARCGAMRGAKVTVPIPQSGMAVTKSTTTSKTPASKKQAAATLRSRTAGSQDESPCRAIHKVKIKDAQARLPMLPNALFDPALEEQGGVGAAEAEGI